uniref:Major facilitator superfamily (MFS) profile domain-containing protein n=1 Tax=Strigamia maritima TaxID=126957 RepID=T1JKY7_STRMM
MPRNDAAAFKRDSELNGCVKFTDAPEKRNGNDNGISSWRNGPRTRSRSQSEASEEPSEQDDSLLSGSSLSCAFEPNSPDGGWGWVVVFAAFMTNLIADGITFSFGVMYVEFVNYFKQSKGKTAWIGSLFMGIPLLAGPIASALTDRFGCRKVTIAGALLAALGFVLSSMSESVELLYFTFGVMSGFGLALCYVAAVVIVAYYFDKRRSFATGLAVCGSGIGTFIFAPLTQYLIAEFRWQGTTLILAGFFLNIVVCGALMRDLEWTKKKYRVSSESLSHAQRVAATTSMSMAPPPPLPPPPPPPPPSPPSSLDNGKPYHQPSERLCNSLVQLPTFLKNSDALPPDVLEMLSNNRVTYEFVVEHYPYLLTTESNASATLPSTAATVAAHRRRLPPNWAKIPNRRLSTAFFHNLRIHRHSITHRGAMLNIHRYHLRASSCPDIYRNSMITISQDEENAYLSFVRDLKEILLDMVDVSHFKNVKFLIFCVSNLLLYIWYDVPYIYIADHAIKMGIGEEKAFYLISVIGILNTIGEILLGYVGDKPWVSTTLLYAAFTAICGVVLVIVPFLTDLYGLCTVAGIFGFAISANYSLTSIIIVDLITLENFTNAYGLLLLVQGVANLIGPPLAGWLCDLTDSYDLSFYMAGLWIFISGAMMTVLPLLKLYRRWRERGAADRDDAGAKITPRTNNNKRCRKKVGVSKETCI